MELPLKMSTNSTVMGQFGGRGKQLSISWYSSWFFWISAIVICGALYFVYKKYPNKIKAILSFKKKKRGDSSIPDWIKKVKEKEKR